MEGNLDKSISFAKDITFVEDNLPFKRKQYIVGSKEKNSYFHVSYEQFRILQKIKDYVEKGVKSPKEIQSRLLSNEKVKVDMNDIYNILDKNSLLEHSSRNSTNSEAETVGLSLYNKDFRFNSSSKTNSKALKILMIFSLIVASLIIALNFDAIWRVLQAHKFTFNNSTIKGFLIGGVISFIVLVLHEFAHILAARNIGMVDAKFSIILYASFIPTYFTRYDGIELRTYKERIRVLSAGIKVNIFLMVVSASLLALPNMNANYYDIISKFVIVNLQFIGINISPFAMNDGYYIMLNLFGLSGIRLKMWNVLKMFVKGDKQSIKVNNKVGIFVYTLISLSFIGFNAWILLSWIGNIILEILK